MNNKQETINKKQVIENQKFGIKNRKPDTCSPVA